MHDPDAREGACSMQPGMFGVPQLSGELVTCSCLSTCGGISMETLQIMAWLRLG